MLYQGGQLQTKCSTKVGSFKQNESRFILLYQGGQSQKNGSTKVVSGVKPWQKLVYQGGQLQKNALSGGSAPNKMLYQGGQFQTKWKSFQLSVDQISLL